VRKCPYCDFNSHRFVGAIDEAGFVDALLADLDAERARAPVPRVDSLFIGGGTPSLLSGAAVAALLDGVAARVTLADDCEITLEANPGTVDAAHFRDYRAAGVNRLSIGIQSLDPGALEALGRIHEPGDARRAVDVARSAGFDNLNLDLMYGLPGHGVKQALDDLEGLMALEPEHLSWYQLTLEPNTAFHHHPPAGLPDEDALADMADAGLARLQAAGFRRYEVSAFARRGLACRHNLNYWRFGDYLGIGPGAHGKRSLGEGGIVRRTKRRAPDDYLASAPTGALSREWVLEPDDRIIEFMLNALRLVDGVPLARFAQATGLRLQGLASARDTAIARGLLVDSPDRLRASPNGLRYLNDLLALFLPDGAV
jgi:oxygen-independent coproporphyrinogen-3 oxidase